MNLMSFTSSKQASTNVVASCLGSATFNDIRIVNSYGDFIIKASKDQMTEVIELIQKYNYFGNIQKIASVLFDRCPYGCFKRTENTANFVAYNYKKKCELTTKRYGDKSLIRNDIDLATYSEVLDEMAPKAEPIAEATPKLEL